MTPKNLSAVAISVLVAALVLLSLQGTTLAQQPAQSAQQVVYVCPMDRDVKSAHPGQCPKCGMALRAVNLDAVDSSAANAAPSEQREGRVDELHIPDTTVYDQEGRKLRFYTDLVKGKTVAINFIFTTCTTICPPLTATFRQVQKNLGARVGRDIGLISVTVDPAVDIPERMKSFAAKFHAEAGWTFVTGEQGNIEALLTALGAYVPNRIDHTPMILVGSEAASYWTRANGLAPATKLAKIISDVADR